MTPARTDGSKQPGAKDSSTKTLLAELQQALREPGPQPVSPHDQHIRQRAALLAAGLAPVTAALLAAQIPPPVPAGATWLLATVTGAFALRGFLQSFEPQPPEMEFLLRHLREVQTGLYAREIQNQARVALLSALPVWVLATVLWPGGAWYWTDPRAIHLLNQFSMAAWAALSTATLYAGLARWTASRIRRYQWSGPVPSSSKDRAPQNRFPGIEAFLPDHDSCSEETTLPAVRFQYRSGATSILSTRSASMRELARAARNLQNSHS